MGELFGDWIPDEWVQKILDVIRENPQWEFLLLTKNPTRYLDFVFPENCWLGATADTQKRADIACSVFEEMALDNEIKNIKFLSMEPLTEKIILPERYDDEVPYEYRKYSIPVDWLIIGGMSSNTKVKAMQPEWEWVVSLVMQAEKCNVKYFWKKNLEVRPEQYPEKNEEN
jgi:protein gp37